MARCVSGQEVRSFGLRQSSKKTVRKVCSNKLLKPKGEYNMTSRTPEGKHVTRFIVLKKSANMGDSKFIRSINIPEAFETKEAAQTAIDTRGVVADGLQYKVRQK